MSGEPRTTQRSAGITFPRAGRERSACRPHHRSERDDEFFRTTDPSSPRSSADEASTSRSHPGRCKASHMSSNSSVVIGGASLGVRGGSAILCSAQPADRSAATTCGLAGWPLDFPHKQVNAYDVNVGHRKIRMRAGETRVGPHHGHGTRTIVTVRSERMKTFCPGFRAQEQQISTVPGSVTMRGMYSVPTNARRLVAEGGTRAAARNWLGVAPGLHCSSSSPGHDGAGPRSPYRHGRRIS